MVQENNYNRIQSLRTVGSGINFGEYAIGDATPEECLELLLENDDVNVLTDDEYNEVAGFVSLTPAESDFYQYKSGSWVNRTIAQVKVDLAINNVNNTDDASKPISTATQNALNLKADLVAGKVPASQLPSYVDDVEEYANVASFPVTGESGKLYIDLSITPYPTYRWTGSIYAPVGNTLALGETSTTAYRGDRGKIAYDHSQLTHDKAFVGLGNVDNTSDLNKPVSTPQQTALNLKMALAGNETATGLKTFDVTGAYDDARFGDSLGVFGQAPSPSVMFNAYLDNGTWRYKTSGYATMIQTALSTGTLTVYNAPTGLANDPITWSVTQELLQNKDTAFKGLLDLSFASSGQIKFPATQNASADANTLDDYEEGTCSLAFSCSTSGTISISQTTVYTKVGRLVTVSSDIFVTAISSPLGNLNITGFPFVKGNGSRGCVSIISRGGFDISSLTEAMQLFGTMENGASVVNVFVMRNTANARYDNLATYVQNGASFNLTISYEV